MARASRKPKAVAEPITSTGFIDGLKFLSFVTKDVGAPMETHVILNQKTAVASNGVLSAGVLIEEDIFACPHNGLLIEALSKCGQHLSITQLDNNRLSIKSDKFKAVVPCLDPNILIAPEPDMPMGDLDDRFKEALEAVGMLATDTAQQVALASILIQSRSVMATNGKMLFEYWHDIDMPSGLALPKAIIAPLTKIKKKLVKFGFSHSSMTFFFEDKSWIKTQFFVETWPDVSHILNVKSNAFPVPNDFFKALDAVAPFSSDGFVYLDKDLLRSHEADGAGATYELAGLPKSPSYSAKLLSMIKPYAEKIDFIAPGPHEGTHCLMFFGKVIRGVIMGKG